MKKVDMLKKNCVSVYLRNHDEGPSCYYRIVQYVNHIDSVCFKINDALSLNDFRRNMDVKNGLLKKVFQIYLFVVISIRRIKQICFDLRNRPKYIIIQREIFPRKMLFFLKYFYKKMLSQSYVVWDFDDSILLSGEISKEEWLLLSEYSNVVVATSDYLLDDVNTNAIKLQMPTTDGFCDSIDLSVYSQRRINVFDEIIKLVWVGTHSNLKNIVKIIPQLDNAGKILIQHQKKLELNIVCNIDSPELYADYEGLKIKFIKWTRENAQNSILDAHIGLMPLPDNAFSKGKGGFKLVQYISSGIPVVASDVGFNREIITNEIGFLIKDDVDWTNAVVGYGLHFEAWKNASDAARSRYAEKFSFKHNLNQWKRILV